jgi:hypothetical protein
MTLVRLPVFTRAHIHSASQHVMNPGPTRGEGIKVQLEPSQDRLLRLSQLWLDAGYTAVGKGADWVERKLGWTAQIERHPPKLAPDDVMKRWV